MSEYRIQLYPSMRNVEKTYGSLEGARAAAIRYIKRGECTQGTIYGKRDKYDYSLRREYGAVFVNRGKYVYRREIDPYYKSEYGLWELYPNGSVSKRLG